LLKFVTKTNTTSNPIHNHHAFLNQPSPVCFQQS
jgi:hypothetical protein